MADGKFVPMPQGYPKFENIRNKKFLIFRVPWFSDLVTIDPVVNVVKHIGEKPTTEGKHTNVFLAIFVLIVVLLFL